MKKYFALIFLLACLGVKGQVKGFNDSKCGTWVLDNISESVTSTDTINFNPKGDTTWFYSEWENTLFGRTYLVYCPCGCGYPDIELCYRVNDKGIRQQLKRVTTYQYIEPPETAYDKKVRELQTK